jgi:hypothetical protein
MALHLKRKDPNKLSKGNGTSTSQSPCKASSSSDTHKNSFHLEKQLTNTKPIKNSKKRLRAEEVIKQNGEDWTGFFNERTIPSCFHVRDVSFRRNLYFDFFPLAYPGISGKSPDVG